MLRSKKTGQKNYSHFAAGSNKSRCYERLRFVYFLITNATIAKLYSLKKEQKRHLQNFCSLELWLDHFKFASVDII